jgi:hypothetical protein
MIQQCSNKFLLFDARLSMPLVMAACDCEASAYIRNMTPWKQQVGQPMCSKMIKLQSKAQTSFFLTSG